MHRAADILATLDAACDSYVFPMLDNGYIYLAATRLSLFRSPTDWALVTEIFGYSPRSGLPDLAVATFASCLHRRDAATDYVSIDAYHNYLRTHPHDDTRYFYPLDEGAWLDEELVADDDGLALTLRGRSIPLPPRSEYARVGIELQDPDRVHVYELSRYLAAVSRSEVLATPSEQRVSVMPEMERLLVLDDWHHPDLVRGERPSSLESFQQFAQVLSTGDPRAYTPTASPNTHWRNWPDGGSL